MFHDKTKEKYRIGFWMSYCATTNQHVDLMKQMNS